MWNMDLTKMTKPLRHRRMWNMDLTKMTKYSCHRRVWNTISAPALSSEPDTPESGARTLPKGLGARLAAWVGLVLSLSVVSCEYNADLIVRIPRWETATSPLNLLDVHTRSAQASAEGPWSAETCQARPDQVVISFVLANERDQPVREGDRLRVGDQVIRPEASRLLDPLDPSQHITLSLLSLEGSGDPMDLSGDILDVRFRAAPAKQRRLVILQDHGREVGERDPSDERIAAYAELVLEALCIPEPPLGCTLPTSTHLSLYRLGGGTVVPLVMRSRNRASLENALEDLRHAAEMGAPPYFRLPDGVRPGGIPLGFSECDGIDSLSVCAPAVLLAAGATQTTDVTLDQASLPEGARLFAAGLVDRPDLRRLACQTGGFFQLVERPAELRMLVNRSVSHIPDHGFGFVRKALMAMAGHWELVVSLSGVPSDLDLTSPHRLSGTLSVTLGDQTISTELRSIVGGY